MGAKEETDIEREREGKEVISLLSLSLSQEAEGAERMTKGALLLPRYSCTYLYSTSVGTGMSHTVLWKGCV